MSLSVSPQEAAEAYTHLVTNTPLVGRLLIGAAALALLLAGAKLYRMALVAPGILLGVFVASSLPATWTFGSKLIVGILVSLLSGLLLFFIEKVGVRVAGATIAGWLVWVLWPVVLTVQAPWWALAGAALVGLIAFPAIFPTAVRWITSALGALLGAWALNYPTNPLIILGLAAAGVMVQSLTARHGSDEEMTR